MPEHPKEPTNQELLQRIAKLEADNERLVACLFDLRRGQEILMPTMVDHFTRIYDLLVPVVEKVFPNFREMKDKVDAIIPPIFADPRADRARENEHG